MPNRYACDVLKEMRKITEAINEETFERAKLIFPMLIEELQSMLNRMEARLYDISDLETVTARYKKLEKRCEELKIEIDKVDKIGSNGEDTSYESLRELLGG